MVYGTYNYSYWGESKPTYNVWGPHIVAFEAKKRFRFPARRGIYNSVATSATWYHVGSQVIGPCRDPRGSTVSTPRLVSWTWGKVRAERYVA